MRTIRELKEQNAQLRGQIDVLAKGPAGAPEPKADSKFDPQVAEAIKGIVMEQLAPLQGQIKQQIGYLYDKTDEVTYETRYGSERFVKLKDRVDQIRHEQQLKGNWVSREEALRIAHFEQTGKKPQADPPKPEEQVKAQWDPYLQQYVDPTGKVVPPPVVAQPQQPVPGQLPQAGQAPQMPQLPPAVQDPNQYQPQVPQPAPVPGGIPA
jgi:hypothetical protein